MSKPLRILLIEDCEDILFLLTSELEWMGYRVDPAGDAEAALKLARTTRPDLILSDVLMPGMSGVELLRQMREIPGLSEVPAVAVTGFGLDSEIGQIKAAGFAAWLVKPVEVHELAALIEELTQPLKMRKAS